MLFNCGKANFPATHVLASRQAGHSNRIDDQCLHVQICTRPDSHRPPMRACFGGLSALGFVFPMIGSTMLLVWISERLLFASGKVARRR
jgi:uncharacterized iron-regulated membrane protein